MYKKSKRNFAAGVVLRFGGFGMWRLILVTFAFLGWGFYELSGGPGYEPRAGSLQAESYTVFRAPHVPVTEIASAPRPGAEVSRAALDLTGLPGITAAVAAPAGIAPAIEKAVAIATPRPATVTLAAAEPAAPPQKDIREISGSVVNLRAGPGTKHGIITKLRLGEVVEVLGDPGEGWLKLRVVGTGRIGWMSDTLVTAAAG